MNSPFWLLMQVTTRTTQTTNILHYVILNVNYFKMNKLSNSVTSLNQNVCMVNSVVSLYVVLESYVISCMYIVQVACRPS